MNMIRRLGALCDVHLLAFLEHAQDSHRASEIAPYCLSVRTVVRDESTRIPDETIPRSARFFYTPAMRDELERALAEIKPDCVHIEFMIMTPYVRHMGSIPAVYTEHDMSFLDFDQSFHDRDMPEKERFYAWAHMIESYRALVRSFSHVIVLTGRDQRLLEAFSPGARTHVITTGVDTGHFRFRKSARDAVPRSSLVFVGHYPHYPNTDAAVSFVSGVLPLVAERVPDVSLDLVGSGVTPAVAALAGDHVRVVGEVDDVLPWLHSADLFVAPVRRGGGIKGKILEAMSAGLPVVAHQEAAAGIDHRPGDLLVAVSDAEYADHIIALLRDPDERAAMALRARRLVELKYDWDMLARRQFEVYAQCS